MKTQLKIKKTILISLIISFPFLCLLLLAAYDASESNSINGGAFILMMVIMGCFTGLICLITWITMLVNSNYALFNIPIFISVHTALWEVAWFFAMILFPDIEDKVPLFFLFPMIVGLLSIRKVFKSMNNLNDPS